MKKFSTLRVLVSSTFLRVLVLGLSLATNIVLSRALGVSDRGNYQIAIVIASLMMSVGSLSIELSLSQMWAETKSKKRQQGYLASTALTGCLALGILSGITIGLISFYIPLLDEEFTGGMAILLGVSTLVMLIRAGTQRVLFLTGRPVWAATSTVLESMLFLGLLITSNHSGLLDVQFAVSCFVAGMSLSAIIGLWKTREYLSWPKFEIFSKLLRNGLRFHPGQLAIVLLVRLDLVILGILSTPQQAGLYAVAIAITGPLDVLGLAITTTFLNRIFTGAKSDAILQTQKLMRLSVCVIPAMAMVAALLVPIVVPVLWGKEFSGTVSILWLLLPGACALSIQRPLGQFMVRMGLSRSMNARAGIALIVNLVLNIWLIPIYGGIGAALACSLSYLTYAGLSLVFFARYTNTPLSVVLHEMLPRMSDLSQVLESFRNSRRFR